MFRIENLNTSIVIINVIEDKESLAILQSTKVERHKLKYKASVQSFMLYTIPFSLKLFTS